MASHTKNSESIDFPLQMLELKTSDISIDFHRPLPSRLSEAHALSKR